MSPTSRPKRPRKGEKSAEFEGSEEEFRAVYGEMTFIDLKDPMLTSA